MKQIKIDTLIFDMDGTIVDTEETCAQVVKDAFRKWGHTITHEDTYSMVGRKFDAALHYLREKYPIAPSFQESLDSILIEYRKKIASNVAVVPGVVPAIQSLSRDFNMALVSGSHRIEILMILEQLKIKEYFQVILGSEDYSQSKPEPDGYMKAMNLLGVDPKNVLVFEDSKAGLISAKAANTWTTLVTHTQCSTKEIHLADSVIPNFLGVHHTWIKEVASNWDRAK